MATRVEKQIVDGTEVVVGYGVISVATYNAGTGGNAGYTTYSTQDVVVDVEIDYSSFYERIATAMETIAAQSTTTATNTTTIANKQTAMETYQKRLKELGEGNGIRVIGPYELVQFVTTYRTLIEEGKILSYRDKIPSDKEVGKALNDLGNYIAKIKQNIPKDF